MNKLDNIQYITIASGTRFKDTGKKMKLGDSVYYTDNEGNIETGEVFMMIDRARQDIIFYSTKEACEPEQIEKRNLMQEKIQNAIQKLTSEINESILCGRKDGWVDYALGDKGLSANSYDGFSAFYDYGFGANISCYADNNDSCINREHQQELQKDINEANKEFWLKIKDIANSMLKCRSLKKYLNMIQDNEDLLQEYDDFIRLWTQEQTCNILTKVTYWEAGNIFNKTKEDFVRIESWIRYGDRDIKVCFDKVYNVDDFLHLVDNEIDDLADEIFETIDGQPIITDIDKYLDL
jgi:hypothetical protein